MVGLVGVVGAGWLDYWLDVASHYDFVQTGIYLLPVGFVAWACGLKIGSVVGFVAVAVEVSVSFVSMGGRHSPDVLMTVFALELATTTACCFLLAKLRYSLELERSLSRTDALTGTQNSRSFWEVMEVEIERMKRDSRPLTVMFIDVDNFKKVNDSLGHKEGDRILKCIGQALMGITRSIDAVARIGGDEFAVLLPGADQDAGKLVAERLKTTMNKLNCDASRLATLSIGLATFKTPPDTTETLLHAADLLMYEAKSAGKDRLSSRVY